MINVVTWELIIKIIISRSSIISKIVHCNKLKEIYTGILPMMLKIMRYKPGCFK